MTAPVRQLHAVNPTTGEIITPDQLNERVVLLANTLEEEAHKLTTTVHELARVADLYNETYDAALLASDKPNKEQREADARQACRLARTPLGHPLAKRRNDLEHEVRAMRDEHHSLRAVLSGWQTASANIRAAMGGWGAS